MPNSVTAADALTKILPEGRVSVAPKDLETHARDWSPRALLEERMGVAPPLPACVVRPTTTSEVAAILTWADGERIPIVPFGGGSSVVGGIGYEGAVSVDLKSMDEIVAIDPKSLHVTAQAGVTGPKLDRALYDRGLMLGHEPQSHDISTVGGWVATKACGQLSARYGGIETLVAGLEAVLPGGRIIRSKITPRRSVGPDIGSLMIGSEGTLGIVTEVTLRVASIPRDRADLCLRFESMADGVAACRALAHSDLTPTVVRLYDADDAALFLRHHPDEPQGPLLILSFDGSDPVARADAALELCGGTQGNSALADHWWEHRNDAVAEFRRLLAGDGLLGPHGIVETMELAGTWSILRDLYHSTKEKLLAEADFVACHLSHLYPDGACLYFTMGSACESDTQATSRLELWWDVGMRSCLDAGGSISHHHGVGRRKAPWLDEESTGWWEVLRTIKHALDPNSIMNPGVFGL